MTAVPSTRSLIAWRGLVVLLAGLFAGALTAAPAGAHAYLVGSVPEDEETVTDEVDAVVLEFNEEVDLPQVEVLDPDGESVTDGDAEDLGEIMEQPLGELSTHGTYSVEWRVVSEDDHPITGEFTFEYEGPAAEEEAPAEEPADDPAEPADDPADEPADEPTTEGPAVDDADEGPEESAEEPVEEPAEETDEELAAEPTAAETEEGGGLPMGLIAAVVVIAVVAAAFFALRGRAEDEAGPQDGG